MQYNLFETEDNAQGQLDSGVGASDLSIVLKSGEGAEFPAAATGTASSTGDSNTLNSTGIQALGVVEVGDFIENITDGSHAFVISISTNQVITTTLLGGGDNTWQSSDTWAVNRFVVTLNQKDANGSITQSEKVLIDSRSSDTLTVNASGRGYDGDSGQEFDADDYVELFVTSKIVEGLKTSLAEAFEQIDLKADLTYVNSALAAKNWKDSVIAASTTDLTLASDVEDGDTLDGVTLSTGDRILIKDQSDASENGIYIVAASGAPSRATDFDSASEATSAVVPVEGGTSNEDTVWLCTSDDPVIDTDDVDFTQFGASATIASQAEAEAGSNNSKMMTPLRTSQAIEALQNISDADATTLTGGGNADSLHEHDDNMTVWIPAVGAWTSGGQETPASPGGAIPEFTWGLQNSAEDRVYFACQIPKGATGISSIKAIGAGGGSGDVVLHLSTYFLKEGANEGDDTTGANVTGTVSTNQSAISFGSDCWDGLGTLEGNGQLSMEVRRKGSDGADTLSSDYYLAGVKITFS